MTAFHDLPDATRMGFRDAITDAGGEVEGYDGECVVAALPNAHGFLSAVGARGLELVGDLWLFPLGTDSPPAILRHDGRYPGSKGFWLFGRFRPKARAER